jgi:hypothetical protein
MPFILALFGAAAAVYFFVIRTRNTANAAQDIVEIANDVRLAARRFGFSRQTNIHPVEQIEDARVAVAALIKAVIDENGMAPQDIHSAYLIQLQKGLQFNLSDSKEVVTLANWLIASCNGASPAISRLSRKLYKMSGSDGAIPVLGILNTIYAETDMSARQIDALDDIKRAMRVPQSA